MGTFVINNTVELPYLRQAVFLNGYQRSDIFATQVTNGLGTQGSTASLIMPSVYWDGGKKSLRGRHVRIMNGYEGEGYRTIFTGYINNATGDSSGNFITAECVSLIGLSDTVYIGQNFPQYGFHVKYPETAFRNGSLQETGWRIQTILRDFFSTNQPSWKGGGGSIPSQWRSNLKLGSLSVLNTVWNDFPIGDLEFKQTTLRDALDQLLGLVGTITFRERFESFETTLEFFELADPGAPTRTVWVAKPGESIVGKNVLSISHSEGAEDVRTRMIGMGDFMKFLISVTSNHPTAPLKKGWNSALESAVLANPESTKRGSEAGQLGDQTRQEFTEEKRHVFRRFFLPDCLRGLLIDKDNAVQLDDGKNLEIQVWKFPRKLTQTSGVWTSTLSTIPTLLEGTEFDLENLTFTLKEPAVNMVSGTVDGSGNIIDVYEPAVVGITITVNGNRLLYDTGVKRNGIDHDRISGAGLTEIVENTSFKYIQITNEGFSFDGEEFNNVWLYVEGTGWTNYQTKVMVQDDERALTDFTKMALREKNNVKTVYSVTTPFFTNAFRLGDKITVRGQDDFIHSQHQILSISHDLTNNHQTTISTDSSVPMIANEVLKSGGG